MQNSAKHLTATLIGFAILSAGAYITLTVSTESAKTLSSVYSLGVSAVLSVICIIIAIRHIKLRRYFISLCMVMFCNCFAELYMGLTMLLRGTSYVTTSILPIPEIAYLGANAFIAALCARIWFEEIPKSAVSKRKTAILSVTAALVVLLISGISFFAGYPSISGIFDVLFVITALWYSVRFFTIPGDAKPFLPLMTVITLYLLYGTIWKFLIPLIPCSSSGILSYSLICPLTLLQMLFIPCLLRAGEQMKKKADENTVPQNTQEAP